MTKARSNSSAFKSSTNVGLSYKVPTLEEYKQAVWDYMIEHCEISESGAYFVRFHMSKRSKFEGHILNRWEGYHREDVNAKQGRAVYKRDIIEKERILRAQQKRERRRIKRAQEGWGRLYKYVKWLYEPKSENECTQ